jgi:hypothetical protein
VLLSTPLHASSNFTVYVQLANKRGLKISVRPFQLHTLKRAAANTKLVVIEARMSSGVENNQANDSQSGEVGNSFE